MTWRRRRPTSLLALATCSILLATCAQEPTPPNPAVRAGQGDAATRRAEIARQIAAVCPPPTNWTPAQRSAVADFIERHAGEAGNDLLAREWARLNAGARLCRMR